MVRVMGCEVWGKKGTGYKFTPFGRELARLAPVSVRVKKLEPRRGDSMVGKEVLKISCRAKNH